MHNPSQIFLVCLLGLTPTHVPAAKRDGGEAVSSCFRLKQTRLFGIEFH